MSAQPEDLSFAARLRRLASGHGSNTAIRIYTILYVLVISVVFTAAVAVLHHALESTRKANVEAGRQRTLLTLLDCIEPGKPMSIEEIGKAFTEQVEEVKVEGETMVNVDGKRLTYTYYKKSKGGNLRVIPLWGSGFWGFMAGYAAIDPAEGSLKGIEFVRHEETPGLGGRIGDADVKTRFSDVPYNTLDSRGRRISLVADSSKSDHPGAVDAITGATGTSSGVEKILNSCIDRYLETQKNTKEAGK